jgi:hypothetical protein
MKGDDDIDCDSLEKKMMMQLDKEKKMIRNWHILLMRV